MKSTTILVQVVHRDGSLLEVQVELPLSPSIGLEIVINGKAYTIRRILVRSVQERHQTPGPSCLVVVGKANSLPGPRGLKKWPAPRRPKKWIRKE